MREPLEVREQVVAQIELDVAGDADEHPASQKLEDALSQRQGDDYQRVDEKFVPGYAGVEIVDGAAQDLRKQYPDAVIE